VQRTQVEDLFARYREPVFRFLRRFLRDGAAAEDLTQETFLRALKGDFREALSERSESNGRALGGACQPDGKERGWVFQIARNLARDHTRAHARRPRTTELGDPAAPGRDAALAMALDAALATLDEDDREVFLLKEIAGLSYAEISNACGLTPDAVRSRLHRTRLALRRQLT
jgi:RNA polymerase sigma-70 factor, ECF subfamily